MGVACFAYVDVLSKKDALMRARGGLPIKSAWGDGNVQRWGHSDCRIRSEVVSLAAGLNMTRLARDGGEISSLSMIERCEAAISDDDNRWS